MSRMWRVQRRAFADEQRRRASKSNNVPHQTWLSRTASFVGKSMDCSTVSSIISTVKSGNGLASATAVFASNRSAKGRPQHQGADRNDHYRYIKHLSLSRARQGKALRDGIGLGREGFTWSGAERISRVAEWPTTQSHRSRNFLERRR